MSTHFSVELRDRTNGGRYEGGPEHPAFALVLAVVTIPPEGQRPEMQREVDAFWRSLRNAANDDERLEPDTADQIHRAFASERAAPILDAWAREVVGDYERDPEGQAREVAAQAASILKAPALSENPAQSVADTVREHLQRGEHGRKLAKGLGADHHLPKVRGGAIPEGPHGVAHVVYFAGLPWPFALVESLWHDHLKARADRARQKPVPAVPRAVTEALVVAPDRIAVSDAGAVTVDGVPTALSVANGVGLQAAQDMVRQTLDLAAFWSVLGWVLDTHRNQYIETGSINDASVIEIGGISELSRAVMGYEGGASEGIRNALRLGQTLEVHAVQGERAGGLWTWAERKANRWHPGVFRIVLGAPLRLDAGSIMPGTMRLLAPVVSPDRTPSLKGFQPRMFGRLRAADQYMMNLLAERTDRAIVEDGRVWVPFDRDADRKRIANDVGLTDRTSARWLERMTEGDVQGVLPPGYSGPVVQLASLNMIEVTEPGARALLADQTNIRQGASEAGRRSAQKRSAARKRSSG
jgi:hypothetical protein